MTETIMNRSLLLIRMKQPFIEWIKKCDPSSPLPEELINKNTIYLIEDIPFQAEEELEKVIKKHYKEIFTDQLNGWYTDESLWPAINLNVFKEWLHFEHIEEGIDLLKSKIKKENLLN